MRSLIDIHIQDGKQSVNARDLHAFLGVKKDFTNWMKYNLSIYSFSEGEDYTIHYTSLTNLASLKHSELQKGDYRTEYVLSIDMAKELAMVSRCERGKQARQYFIACDRQLREGQLPALPATHADALRELANKVEENARLENKIIEMKPKADLHDLKHTCGTAITIKQFTDNLPVGLQTFYQIMRDWNWVCSKNSHCPQSPTRYGIDQGYLVAKSYTGNHTDGSPFEKVSSRITVKGQQRAIAKLRNAGIIVGTEVAV